MTRRAAALALASGLLGVPLGVTPAARAEPPVPTAPAPARSLRELRRAVEDAAADVARARAEGERRKAAAAMVVYRQAADELERLEAASGPSVEAQRSQIRTALAELVVALAEGQRDNPARDVVAAWLGEPVARLGLLRDALVAAEAAPGDVRRGVLLDVVDNADALAVLLAFDASSESRRADQLELRALGLRRSGPGQAAPIGAEVEAVELDAEAAAAEAHAVGLMALREQVVAVRSDAERALGGGR